MLYTVGEMAKFLNIAPSTLRFYDKEGLLPFIERSSGGVRMFKEEDYELLKLIGCLKATGMSIKDIKGFIGMVLRGDESIDERLQLFYKQKAEIEKQIADLQDTLEVIDFKCWYYETAKKAGTTAIPQNMTDNELPEKIRATRKRLQER